MEYLKKHTFKILYLTTVSGVAALSLLLPQLSLQPAPPGQAPGVVSNETPAERSQPAVSEAAEVPDPRPASAQTGESLVVLDDQAAINRFLADNQLAAGELEPTGLEATYKVGREFNELDTAGVEAYPNLKYQVAVEPDDPCYAGGAGCSISGSQWHLPKIKAPAGWDITTGSADVTVAVIDTGFALTHEDLAGKLTASGTWRDFVCDDNVPQAGDCSDPGGEAVNHGTLTAGAAAAVTNNTTGVAGVDWAAKILPLQALGDDGSGSTAEVAEAVEYATAQGVDVISMSLGSKGSDPLLRGKIDDAIAAGITVVAAIGNCGGSDFAAQGCDFQGQQLDPGRYGPVIGVGASNSSDQRASFSSYGSGVDLIAPGVSIRTTNWSSSNETSLYGSASGTSLSTPLVSGAAALLAGLDIAPTPQQVANLITAHADKVPQMSGANRTDQHGFGRLNLQGSLRAGTIVHPDGSVARNNATGSIYVVRDDTKLPIQAFPIYKSQFSQFGITYNTATLSDLDLPDGTAINYKEGTLLKSNTSATVYIVDDTGAARVKRPFSSWSVFSGLGYKASRIITTTEAQLPGTTGPLVNSTTLHPDGTLVKDPNSSSIFLIESSTKRPIGSAYVYLSHYGSFTDTFVTATSGDMALVNGTSVQYREGVLLKASNSATIYVVDDTGAEIVKRPVSSWAVFQVLGYKANQILTVPASALPAANGDLVQ